MAATAWPTPSWPEGVAREISGYEKPLFSILDDAARDYPQLVYTMRMDV